jgi:hypothetical protein
VNLARVDWLVVHTAGSYDWRKKRVVHQLAATVRAYHMMPVARHDVEGNLVKGTGGNGWSDIGYHAYIEHDGTIIPGRSEQTAGDHVKGFNRHSKGICVSGHGDFEAFNPEQLSSLVLRLTRWCRQHQLPASRVIGHREADDHGAPKVMKTCPGLLVDMDAIRDLVGAKLIEASA